MLRGFIALVLLLTLFSCNPNRVYEKHEGIPSLVWEKDYILKFEVDIEDISVPYDVNIAVRHAEHFGSRILKVKASLDNPAGLSLTTPWHLVLADEDGKWLGSGMGDIWDIELILLDNYTFMEAGTYTFTIQHDMGQDMVPLVMEIGLIVDKIPPADAS